METSNIARETSPREGSVREWCERLVGLVSLVSRALFMPFNVGHVSLARKTALIATVELDYVCDPKRSADANGERLGSDGKRQVFGILPTVPENFVRMNLDSRRQLNIDRQHIVMMLLCLHSISNSALRTGWRFRCWCRCLPLMPSHVHRRCWRLRSVWSADQD